MRSSFVSWSGGKDSCLAFYKAKAGGLSVRYLANMAGEDGIRSRAHGLLSEVLRLQAQAVGLVLVQRRSSWDNYEAEFNKMLHDFKQDGVDNGIFGDIDIEEHRQWVERVCAEADIAPHLPLWGQSQNKVLADFMALGFEAIIVTVKAGTVGEEWLGRKVDVNFVRYLAELRQTRDITLCGEAGEFHTLVTDGPLFQKRLEIRETKEVFRDGYWFLDILDAGLGDRKVTRSQRGGQ